MLTMVEKNPGYPAMFQPAHVDGRTLVVLQPRESILGGYSVVESGRLEHDGEELRLVGDVGCRLVSDDELGEFQPVTSQNRIAACTSFDFFIVRPAMAS